MKSYTIQVSTDSFSNQLQVIGLTDDYYQKNYYVQKKINLSVQYTYHYYEIRMKCFDQLKLEETAVK